MKAKLIPLLVTGLAVSTNLAAGVQAACDQWNDQQQIEHQQIPQLQFCALQGDLTAQIQLAKLYRLGINVKPDSVEAAKWYKAAADQGNAEAQYHLGVMYLDGTGVTEDSTEALRWISRAAQQKHSGATEVYNYILHHDGPLEC